MPLFFLPIFHVWTLPLILGWVVGRLIVRSCQGERKQYGAVINGALHGAIINLHTRRSCQELMFTREKIP